MSGIVPLNNVPVPQQHAEQGPALPTTSAPRRAIARPGHTAARRTPRQDAVRLEQVAPANSTSSRLQPRCDPRAIGPTSLKGPKPVHELEGAGECKGNDEQGRSPNGGDGARAQRKAANQCHFHLPSILALFLRISSLAAFPGFQKSLPNFFQNR